MSLSFLPKAVLTLPLILIPLSVSGFFYGFFTTLKWQEIYISALLGTFILIYQNRFFVPVFSKKINYLIAALVGVLFLNYFLHDVYFLSEITLHRLAFIFILFSSYSLYKYDDRFFSTISCLITFSFLAYLGAYLFWIFRNELSFFEGEVTEIQQTLAFTFGNINMTAQFVGISLLFSVYNVFFQQNKYVKSLSFFVSVVCFGLLFILNCRSITLALTLSVPFLFLHRNGKRRIVSSTMAFLLGLTLLFEGNIIKLGGEITNKIFSTNNSTNNSTSNPINIEKYKITGDAWKGLSVLHRVGLWQATLAMTVDHPLGVGAGKFQFNSTPYKEKNEILQKMKQELEQPKYNEQYLYYHENYLERTPHNDYLLLLSEEGIIVFILGFLICVLLLSYVPRKNFFEKHENILFLSYGIFIMVESFFQFPFSTAYPFFVTAVMVGGGLQQFFGRNSLEIKSPILYSPFLACSLIYGIFTYGQYIISHKGGEPDLSAFACKMMPMNWKMCSAAAYDCLIDGQPEKAEEILLSQCKLFPHNFVAQRTLLSVYYAQEDMGKFCAVARSYDKLFQDKSSYHEAVAFCEQPQRGNS